MSSNWAHMCKLFFPCLLCVVSCLLCSLDMFTCAGLEPNPRHSQADEQNTAAPPPPPPPEKAAAPAAEQLVTESSLGACVCKGASPACLLSS